MSPHYDDDVCDEKISEVESSEDCFLAEEHELVEQWNKEAQNPDNVYKDEYVWKVVGMIAVLHLGGLIGVFQAITLQWKWQTLIYTIIMAYYATTSVTGGAHRMWTHKAFKANFGVRLFFMLGTTVAAQGHVIWWARQHRCHHKWTDSDADPHNAKRGFFFSHVGWLMVKRHPKTLEMGKKIDLSDLEADELLCFQRDYLWPFAIAIFYLVSFAPYFLWNESYWTCLFFCGFMRLTGQYNGTWCINSVAHIWGTKPFETSISAVDNGIQSFFSNGEAWHNYHHVFPQDYRASELGWKGNLTAVLIDFFAWNGWVWDRKVMSKEAIERQKDRFGDHSRDVQELLKVD